MKKQIGPDDDFNYRITRPSRAKSVPKHVKFADRPFYPESTSEDSEVISKRKHTEDGESPKPLLKDSQYAPTPPSKTHLLKKKLIRRFKRNSSKILGILLFIAFSILLFQIIFRKGQFRAKRLFIKDSRTTYQKYQYNNYNYQNGYEANQIESLSLSDFCLIFILFIIILYLLF